MNEQAIYRNHESRFAHYHYHRAFTANPGSGGILDQQMEIMMGAQTGLCCQGLAQPPDSVWSVEGAMSLRPAA
jgi:hypothetical protein